MTGDGRRATDGGGAGSRERVPDGRYVAVLDRFEATDPADDGEDLAVLLIESDEEVVAERAVPAWRLPEDARREDAVLELSVRNGHVVSVTDDPETTEQRVQAAQSRFDRLAERPESDAAEGGDENADGGQ